MFFVRYDVDGNFEFNNEETGKILDDIDHDRIDRAPEAPDVGDITRYVEKLNISMGWFMGIKGFMLTMFNKNGCYSISRPRSGMTAQQRRKSIMSLFAGDEGGRGNVSFEEFNV